MKIGDMAKAAQTPVETIPYYERAGLLPQPQRSDGNNYRTCAAVDIERLAFIRHCRSLDMTHDEIRLLLRFKDSPAADCGVVNELLDEHIGHVAERIRELLLLEEQLKRLREHCAGANDSPHCGILKRLTSGSAAPRSKAAPGAAHGLGSHSHGPRLGTQGRR